MHILMMTNTYTPIVGGIEEAIRSFAEEYSKLGHKVLIIAPEFDGMPQKEKGVIRIPAIRKFSKTDYSVNLPIPGLLSRFMKLFKPDIIHSHHPFLIGDMALRLSRQYEIPLIFTYHTMFEDYIPYLPIHGEVFRRFVVELAAGYANLCDYVIVPSRNLGNILKDRGVASSIKVVPTGIQMERWQTGDGRGFRQAYGIPDDAFVIGHVGRVCPEKNIEFLAESTAQFLKVFHKAHFLLIGDGPMVQDVRGVFARHGVESRFHHTGILKDQSIVQGYHAMDVFAFTSHSETQGLVLLEAMASGVPVVASDAPAVNEVVNNCYNGRLVQTQHVRDFMTALEWVYTLPSTKLEILQKAARETAQRFSLNLCALQMIDIYRAAKQHYPRPIPEGEGHVWSEIVHRLKGEMALMRNVIDAGETAMKETLLKR